LKVEIVDPDKNDELKKAAEAAGVRPVQMNATNASKLVLQNAYVGIALDVNGKKDRINGIGDTSTLEYDLIRRIAHMTRKSTPKIAWQVNDPYGGMQIPGMPPPRSQDRHTPTGDLREIDEVLKTDYETTTVDLKSKVPDDVKVVVLCNLDSGLTDEQKFHLDQFLMRGGGAIVMADGTEPMSFGGMGGGSMTMRHGVEKLPDEFLSSYGVTIRKNLVADLQCNIVQTSRDPMASALMRYPALPLALGATIDQSHPITAKLSDVIFFFPSSVEIAERPGMKVFTLVKSSEHAREYKDFIDVGFDKIVDEEGKLRDADAFKEQFPLVAFAEGQLASYFSSHPLPKEITDPKPAAGDEHDHGGGLPFDVDQKDDPEPANGGGSNGPKGPWID
ncbi:MAG TPA: GldG family protein, partial [Pirellulaceae bacterium]|nr:GldG family protein [Pirellulaceae bacterium]